jgi:phage gpG-like protein
MPLRPLGRLPLRSRHRSLSRRSRHHNPAPLSGTTQALKERNVDKILVLNGHLRDTPRYQASSRSLKFGTNRIYGAVQQFGAKAGAFGKYKGRPIPWGDIPARPYLWVSSDDETEILAVLADHLTSAVG